MQYATNHSYTSCCPLSWSSLQVVIPKLSLLAAPPVAQIYPTIHLARLMRQPRVHILDELVGHFFGEWRLRFIVTIVGIL